MGLRETYIQRENDHRSEGTARRDALWKERQEFRTLLNATIPNLSGFYRLLEEQGNVEAAIATGVPARLVAEGYARTFAEHLTPEKMSAGCRAWAFEWLGCGGLDVDRSGDHAQAAEAWQRVELTVRASRESREIDTEFFLLNVRAGENPNPYDDREKFHVIWKVPEDPSAPLALEYLGLGTNEPYDRDHPDRGDGAIEGRPRFLIFDRKRSLISDYTVTWRTLAPFDWDWSERPVVLAKDGSASVTFVDFAGASLVPLTDKEVVSAARGLDADKMVATVWRLFVNDGGVRSSV